MTDSSETLDFDELMAQAGIFPTEPNYVVSGSGTGWYYSIEKKSMVRVQRGGSVFILEDFVSGSDKIMCQAGNEIVYIPASEILEIGWN